MSNSTYSAGNMTEKEEREASQRFEKAERYRRSLEWTSTDLQEFAEWCSENGWVYDGLGGWNKINIHFKIQPNTFKTTSDLQKEWRLKQEGDQSHEK